MSDGDPVVTTADGLVELAGSVRAIADAIVPSGVVGSNDAAGGQVESLTEAVMGLTAGLYEVASAIREVAEAKRNE